MILAQGNLTHGH